ncbi:MAG: hypothetical protein H6815_12210 [Phycisphaeraceae bacterium]|nr:hypothetical protein [Phycisphaeraceae bacterium]
MRTNTLASLIAVAAAAHVAIAQTDTTFTYQGELNKLGAPVNGACDFRFQLYDAMSGGSAVTSRVTVSDVSVTDGRFNVDLDFGAEVFDGAERWLSVDVRQPAGAGTYSTLTPRQPITRSPYSIQTRGIFVDGNERVGIGTTAPADELHIQRDGAALRIQDDDDPDSFSIMRDTKMDQMQFQKNTSSGNVFIDIDARPLDQISQSFIRFFRYTTTAGLKRAQFYRGDGTTAISAAIGVDGADSFVQNHGGNFGIGTAGPQATLDVAGNAIVRERLGVGNPSSTFGQVTIADDGAPFAIEAYSSNNVLPSIYASNTNSGPAVWALGTDDTALSGGGLIVAGAESGPNISIDQNEIMARNNGQTSTLYINAQGGNITMGPSQIHPAYAYGYIALDGSIVSASSNIVSVQRTAVGAYLITVDGGFASGDICVATAGAGFNLTTVAAGRDFTQTDKMRVYGYNVSSEEPQNTPFNFVIYRP